MEKRREFLTEIGEAVNSVMIRYWELQGHVMQPSRFIEEMELDIDPQEFSVSGTSVHYHKYVRHGVSAERIPYTRGSGAGSSRYIQGLTKYVKNRMGLQGVEAVSVAFAIANVHKQEGMPTQASRAYSQTGERTRFVENAIEEIERDQILDEIIDRYFGEEIIDKQIMAD